MDRRELRELDVVTLAVDLPDSGLRRGRTGTVIVVHEQPSKAYDVEFSDESGRPEAIVVLRREDLEPPAVWSAAAPE